MERFDCDDYVSADDDDEGGGPFELSGRAGFVFCKYFFFFLVVFRVSFFIGAG